eukprot:GILI01034552.1.p1 GENE.GILI01034552.1~~GILI01034552.1.p1  ORF type:complete len:229 (-),score=6.50 GILI01034552.1:100-786(-)
MRRATNSTHSFSGAVLGSISFSRRHFIKGLFSGNGAKQESTSPKTNSNDAASSSKCISRFPRSVEDPKGAFVGNFPTDDACLDIDNFHNKVPYLRPDVSLLVASVFLRKFDVGCVPVLDSTKKVIGMFSERDLARWVGHQSQSKSASEATVSEVMSKAVIHCNDATTFEDALAIMDKHNFRHLPVMSHKDPQELVGLLSMRDIMHQQVKGKGKGHVDDFMHWVLKMSS